MSMALRFAKATRSKDMSAGSQSRVYRDVNVHKPQASGPTCMYCLQQLFQHAVLGAPAFTRRRMVSSSAHCAPADNPGLVAVVPTCPCSAITGVLGL